ncbi:uncharacterized protein BYT42DRAFT_298007 [Radiomyces spectabilis]|uniref:uncharacterized protein n=1 Tax=Radiomyces spectabilis TaxID=64574 RepID=UPI00221EE8BD|nr:uncharacterized protein BYT42DRAFT_298007 [Radiomyces spectabilis]KAI8381218.1 hypothetical protein BYT42DRAFT_298007 [Radiomyces spectabilis]
MKLIAVGLPLLVTTNAKRDRYASRHPLWGGPPKSFIPYTVGTWIKHSQENKVILLQPQIRWVIWNHSRFVYVYGPPVFFSNEKKKKNSSLCTVALLFLLVLGIGCLVYFFRFMQEETLVIGHLLSVRSTQFAITTRKKSKEKSYGCTFSFRQWHMMSGLFSFRNLQMTSADIKVNPSRSLALYFSVNPHSNHL